MRSKSIRKSRARIAFEIFNYAFLATLAFVFLLPVLHVLAASLSDPLWLNTQSGLILWPHGFTLGGYKLVFENRQLIRGFLNTLCYVTTATALGVLITLVSGYVLAKKDLLWGNTIMLFVSFTMLFGGGIIPTYLVVQKLRLLNTGWALILPFCVSAYNLVIMRTAFTTVPASLEESARLDGAGELTIVFQVLLPLVKATVATITLYYVVQHWNSWFPAAMYIQDRTKYPLQLVLREILIVNDTSSTSNATDMLQNASLYKQLVKYCTIIVSSLPMFIAYPFAMKYFEQGVMIGSIKG